MGSSECSECYATNGEYAPRTASQHAFLAGASRFALIAVLRMHRSLHWTAAPDSLQAVLILAWTMLLCEKCWLQISVIMPCIFSLQPFNHAHARWATLSECLVEL